MPGYAVIDVETTGLSPERHHRIVEVAVVQLNERGAATAEWSTLLNPERDVGAGHIHGLRAADVRGAPTFERIAGALARLLAGRVPVAHNLAFDARFLAAEYARMGLRVPIDPSRGLCTMRMAGTYLPRAAARSLEACCTAAGVRHRDAHAALADARAAAELLGNYLSRAPSPPPWTGLLHRAAVSEWPALPTAPVRPVPRPRPGEEAEHFLSRLVQRLPADGEYEELEPYLAVLDRALIDRHLSAAEADELVDTATYLGLSRATVLAGHRRYLTALADAAREDGVITEEESRDLYRVAELLGLDRGDVHTALSEGGSAASAAPAPLPRAAAFALAAGDHVVFTGTNERSREDWHSRAEKAGLVPRPAVTRRTRVVVAADPDSLSAKARKAREYGLPVITETAFERFLHAAGRPSQTDPSSGA